MAEHKFYISEEGDALIKSKKKKSVSFFINVTIMYFAISFFSALGVREDKFTFGVMIFLFLLLINVSLFLKGNKVYEHLIKEIVIGEQTIDLIVFSPPHKSEKSYTINRKLISLEKGIAGKSDKQINIFEIADTYTLSVKDLQQNHFYFITSYWEEWTEIKKIIDNEQS